MLLLPILALNAAVRTTVIGGTPMLRQAVRTHQRPNWQGEVVYQIFPRSFRDSNGDRNGDLKGIESELGVIQKLGCTAIMLNPIQKSRVYHNYFADDFFAVDPTLGTLADLRSLIRAAHRRRMKVILDMEQQYVADKHPWYRSMTSDPEKDTPFLWRKNRLDMWDKVAWYNGAKVKVSPVNLNNPEVRAMIVKCFQFWADQGLDGFRLDHMMDDLDERHEQTGLYANFWTPLENAVRAKHPNTFFIGEQANWFSDDYVRQILGRTPTDAVFAFPLMKGIKDLDRTEIENAEATVESVAAAGKTEFTFLENHDTMRFASAVPDPRRQRLAAVLLFTLRGTPSIYNGQELGMKGVQGHGLTDGNDIPVRLAYRWTSRVEGPGTAIWYRNTGPWWSTAYSHDNDGVSYQEEDRNPKSLLNLYRALIRLRLATPALRNGSQSFISTSEPHVLIVRRTLGGQTVYVLANLSANTAPVSLPSTSATQLWPGRTKMTGRNIILPGYGALVLRT